MALNPQMMAFCQHYVTNGGNGTAAALAAGYAPNSARQTASQLLARLDVQEELDRIRASHVVHRQLEIQTDPTREGDNTADPTNANSQTRGKETRGSSAPLGFLTRVFVASGLMANLDIAIGRRPTPYSKIVKRSRTVVYHPVLNREFEAGDPMLAGVFAEGDKPIARVEEYLAAATIDVFMRDAAAANRALELLTRELAVLEARRGDADPGQGEEITLPDGRTVNMADFVRGMNERMADIMARVDPNAG